MAEPHQANPSLLIIQVGTPPACVRDEVGDLPGWFKAAIGPDADGADVVKVFDDEPLPEPGKHRAVIITGSWSMVTDLLPWSEATAQWIRNAMALRVALFGVCYGHQLIAHALGGTVGFHPAGREIGCLDVERLPAAELEPLLVGAPQKFKAYLTHLQTIIDLPPGAEVLAHSAHDPHQVVRYGPTVISTQFHPEFTPAIGKAIINARTDVLRSEGVDPGELLSQLEHAPIPVLMLRRFVDAYARNATESVTELTSPTLIIHVDPIDGPQMELEI